MFRNLGVLLAIGLVVYALIDAVRSTDAQRRGVPAAMWAVVIVVFPVVGALIWLWVSRDGRGAGRGLPSSRRSGPTAPDDDPEFLRALDEERRRRQHDGPAEGGTPGA
ncbi:MAG: PLDc N-terminal domain-containing protein [Actinobacteria bacterium]|nr:PLDc N-terminal domain-containing protein [Actinomycetota bacterium]MCG2800647.1 PLDc N-terminal domain-containing protein [Cellulomonas sp.]